MESDRRLAAGIFIVVFLTYASFFGGAGWNQNTLFDLTRAMVERRTFAIDPYASNTYDISVHGGHTYANKPPGVSFLAVAPYALLLTAERLVVKFKLAGRGSASTRAMTVHLYVVTVAVCGVTGAMIPALLYLYLRRKLDVHRRLAVVIALVTAFGTYVFAYSTVLLPTSRVRRFSSGHSRVSAKIPRSAPLGCGSDPDHARRTAFRRGASVSSTAAAQQSLSA